MSVSMAVRERDLQADVFVNFCIRKDDLLPFFGFHFHCIPKLLHSLALTPHRFLWRALTTLIFLLTRYEALHYTTNQPATMLNLGLF